MSAPENLPSPWAKNVKQTTIDEMQEFCDELDSLQGTLPTWVRNTFRAMERSFNSAYGLKGHAEFTSKEYGTIGALFNTLGKINFTEILENPDMPLALKEGLKDLPEEMAPIQEMLLGMDRSFAEVLVDQPQSDQIEFLKARASALPKYDGTPKKESFKETRAIKIYIGLLILAPLMPRIESVTHLNQLLTKLLGTKIMGRLGKGESPKRLAKTCQRLQLSFKKAGRPRTKKKTI